MTFFTVAAPVLMHVLLPNTGKKDGVHGSPHHSSETSPEMLEWVNDDFSDGDKLLDVIHKFKPTVRRFVRLWSGALTFFCMDYLVSSSWHFDISLLLSV